MPSQNRTRLEVVLKPEVKELLQRAADKEQKSLSSFVLESAVHAAKRTLGRA